MQHFASNRPSFIELFVGTLLAPVETFRILSKDAQQFTDARIPQAFFVVLLVFGIDGFRMSSADQLNLAVVSVFFSALLGLMMWFLISTTVGLLAACFGSSIERIRAVFVTLGWSMLPWLFAAPISAMQTSLGLAYQLFLTGLSVWIFFLQVIAINQTFEMKPWQSLCLAIIVPGLFSTFQLVQFIQNLTVLLPGLSS
jgi:hypothetical protein